MSYNPIGFLGGLNGNRTGIMGYMTRLDAAKIPFVIKASDDAGLAYEAQEIAKKSGVPHVIMYRKAGEGWDVPNYDLTPKHAADEHWGKHMTAWPPELDPEYIWLETVNELDKGKADWIGEFCYHTAQLALTGEFTDRSGFKWAGPGWSTGEPEYDDWLTDGFKRFLMLAVNRPSRIAVALHEYSLNVNDIRAGFPYLIGRFGNLLAACDDMGINTPSVLITEWGWTDRDVPDVARAMEDIRWASSVYVLYEEILGCALWYLGGGFGDIADKAQKLIAPMTEFSLGFLPNSPPDPLPDCKGLPRVQYKRTYWVVSPTASAGLSEERRIEIYTEAAKRNITVGPSYDDAGIGDLADKTAVLYGIKEEDREVYRKWFGEWYPETQVQIVNDGESFKLLWPTDEKRVTQVFGARPEYYAQWGLPGHEGIDLAASEGSQIGACHDGEISVARHADDGPYGIWVRIKQTIGDAWGKHKTTYAHLDSVSVVAGERVKAGQPIGIAGNTGNSTGRHLHLGLQLIGATESGETEYPHDYIDPAPYLNLADVVMPGEPSPPPSPSVNWPPGRCLVGLHGRADGRMLEGDYECVKTARIEAVKLLSSAAPENVDRLLAINPDMFIMVRLFVDLSNRVMSPYEFVRDAINDVAMYYAKGVRLFEVHNEPNLCQEGLGKSWKNGGEFATWFQTAVDLMKEQYPDALFGWPGLSPGGDVPGVRMDSERFLSEAGVTVHGADWIGVHCYWVNGYEWMNIADGGYWRYYQEVYPGKLLLITEFSNPSEQVPKSMKAEQYVRYYDWLRNQKPLAAAFCFISSASVGFESETWVGSEIAQIVGARE